jgi:hypothetical protein
VYIFVHADDDDDDDDDDIFAASFLGTEVCHIHF